MITAAAIPLLLDPRNGLGDNIYARPFVRAWSADRAPDFVTVRTPWPELFKDIPNARFQNPGFTGLRTQTKNVGRQKAETWSSPLGKHERKYFLYTLQQPGETILSELERRVGWPDDQPFVFDIPSFDIARPLHQPYAVVRPVTIRTEWPNRARSPHPEYIRAAAELLRAAGYHVITVADIDDRAERAVEPLPVGDTAFVRGELSVECLLALIAHASVVVGGIGWIVPATLATGTPAVFVCGGQGAHNAPARVTDPRLDTSRVRFILPDSYCPCRDMRHACAKTIKNFDARFTAALREVAA